MTIERRDKKIREMVRNVHVSPGPQICPKTKWIGMEVRKVVTMFLTMAQNDGESAA